MANLENEHAQRKDHCVERSAESGASYKASGGKLESYYILLVKV